MTDNTNDPFAQTPHESSAPPPPMPQAPPPEYAAPAAQGSPGQPQYAPPPPGYGSNAGAEKNWMGITALVLSLASLITGITAIGGIILGHMSIAAAKRGEATNGGMGRAGMIIGYIFLVLGILSIIGMVIFFGWVATECGGPNPSAWCNDGGDPTRGF